MALPGISMNMAMPPAQFNPQSISAMSTQEIVNQLQNNKSLTQDQRNQLVDELSKRLDSKDPAKDDKTNRSGGGGGGSEEDELKKILGKLMRGEKLTGQEQQTLNSAMSGGGMSGGGMSGGGSNSV